MHEHLEKIVVLVVSLRYQYSIGAETLFSIDKLYSACCEFEAGTK